MPSKVYSNQPNIDIIVRPLLALENFDLLVRGCATFYVECYVFTFIKLFSGLCLYYIITMLNFVVNFLYQKNENDVMIKNRLFFSYNMYTFL